MTVWPADEEARTILAEYLDGLAAVGEGQPLPTLAADLCDFSGADLSGLYLDDAFLFNTKLTGTRLVNCELRKANLNGADLRGADLSGAELRKAEAVESLAQGATFRYTHMIGIAFARSDLSGADLRDAIMNSGWLHAANLRQADLRGAYLRHTSFGTDDQPTLFAGTRLHGCTFDDMTRGYIAGSADVGEDSPVIIEGDRLAAWFRDRDAGDVRCLPGHPDEER